MERLNAKGPVLVCFVELAHLSSVRALEYVSAWRERYAERGFAAVAVQTSRFAFTADPAWVAEAAAEMAIPVAFDADRDAWDDYGCKGWPSMFLWRRGGVLSWFHFGEGAYTETEQAIQHELRAGDESREMPEPLQVFRQFEHAEARIVRPTEEFLAGGSIEQPWTADPDGDTLTMSYEAGEVWATIEGEGIATVAIDEGVEQDLEIAAPGLYRLSAHPRSERHRLRLVLEPGQRLWSVDFAPGLA